MENVEKRIETEEKRKFYEYVRRIVESARYTGNADHEDVPSILRKFEAETKTKVAREIFEEIEKLSHRFMNDKHYIFGDMVWDIAELKKKYTEEKKDEKN